MAESIGIVVKTESNGYAQIVTDRKGACGGCQSTPIGCKSCLASAKMESRVKNTAGAKTGDLVKLHISTSNLFKGAIILYLVPVFGLLIGSFGGVLAATFFHRYETFLAVAGAITGLVVGYAVVIAVDRSSYVRQRIIPNITSIVTSNVSIPHLEEASCCDTQQHAGR